MPTHLSTLATAWAQAKADEDAARARRIDIEKYLVAEMPQKDEGAVRADADGLRITVTHKLTRSADTDALRVHWCDLSQPARDCLRWLADINLTELRKASPEVLHELSPYLTVKPAKPAVKVEAAQAVEVA